MKLKIPQHINYYTNEHTMNPIVNKIVITAITVPATDPLLSVSTNAEISEKKS